MDNNRFRVLALYENGDSYLQDVLDAIEGACHSISIETYILELPEPGNTLLAVLERKRKQGLEVKLLVDGVGSLHHLEALRQKCHEMGLSLHVFNPLPWRRKWLWLLFPFFMAHFIWRFRLINKRDHRKMVLIDDKVAFLGSINWAHVHFRPWVKAPQTPWSDLAVKVEGSLVSDLRWAFRAAFYRSAPKSQNLWPEFRHHFKEQKRVFPLPHLLRLNHQVIFRYLFWRDLLWRIRRARSRVYIMNAYFVPHRTLLRSLSVAARRGVEVIILLPSESDVPVVKWFAPIFYRRLLRQGIQVREMQGQMIHSKGILIDDWALVGSNNLNYRSLIHDLEVDAVIQEPKWIGAWLAIWGRNINKSRVIQASEILPLSIIQWIRYRMVLFLRYFV